MLFHFFYSTTTHTFCIRPNLPLARQTHLSDLMWLWNRANMYSADQWRHVIVAKVESGADPTRLDNFSSCFLLLSMDLNLLNKLVSFLFFAPKWTMFRPHPVDSNLSITRMTDLFQGAAARYYSKINGHNKRFGNRWCAYWRDCACKEVEGGGNNLMAIHDKRRANHQAPAPINREYIF